MTLEIAGARTRFLVQCHYVSFYAIFISLA